MKDDDDLLDKYKFGYMGQENEIDFERLARLSRDKSSEEESIDVKAELPIVDKPGASVDYVARAPTTEGPKKYIAESGE
tara:strand:+ start:63 stop:299 length:237 start_codon:yes stop_codon:yes gene_type:complete